MRKSLHVSINGCLACVNEENSPLGQTGSYYRFLVSNISMLLSTVPTNC